MNRFDVQYNNAITSLNMIREMAVGIKSVESWVDGLVEYIYNHRHSLGTSHVNIVSPSYSRNSTRSIDQYLFSDLSISIISKIENAPLNSLRKNPDLYNPQSANTSKEKVEAFLHEPFKDNLTRLQIMLNNAGYVEGSEVFQIVYDNLKAHVYYDNINSYIQFQERALVLPMIREVATKLAPLLFSNRVQAIIKDYHSNRDVRTELSSDIGDVYQDGEIVQGGEDIYENVIAGLLRNKSGILEEKNNDGIISEICDKYSIPNITNINRFKLTAKIIAQARTHISADFRSKLATAKTTPASVETALDF